MDQRCFHCVNKLLHRLKYGNMVDPAAAKLLKLAIDALGLSGLTMYQTRHRSATPRSVAPLSPSLAPKQVGNTRATSRSIVDRANAGPAVHKRMTGKYLLNVFGLGKSVKSCRFSWLCARHKVWSQV